MTPPDRSPLDQLKDASAALGADVREMFALRLELARRELQADVRSLRRFAVGALAAGIMALTALPLLATAAAHALDGCWGISTSGWLVLFGLFLLTAAAAIGLLAWRRFRRNFVGLAETREEIGEDMVWLRDWTGR